MNEMGMYMYTSVCKIVLNLVVWVKLHFVSTILLLGRHCFLPLFAKLNKKHI